MLLNRYGQIALWIIVYVAVGWCIGRATNGDIQSWYPNLIKPPLNPPNIVFPIVWTALYVMMAIAGWTLWTRRHLSNGHLCFKLFAIQTAMNWLWSFIFFEWHMLGLAFGWILLMIPLAALLIFKARTHARPASILLAPYLLWISFAAYLSGSIWFLN
jgi:benzodiazapine receptor